MAILKSYVDDLAQSARARSEQVVQIIVDAATDLKADLEHAGFVLSGKLL